MGSMEDIVCLPDDGAALPAEAVAAITNSNAYPEATGYSKRIDYVDFEMHGKPFTQVVLTLRPETPRLHDGRHIVVVAGEGGSDNGNGFLATYEGEEGAATSAWSRLTRSRASATRISNSPRRASSSSAWMPGRRIMLSPDMAASR